MSLSIGNEIKDGFKETYDWVHQNIKWLKDTEQFYRERAKLEREYSEKLSKLCGEFLNRKSNISVTLSVGEKPATTPGSLEAASVVAWNEILSQTENIAKDHMQLAHELDGEIGGQLSGLNSKLDITLNKIQGFNTEMVEKKDGIFNEMEKAKKNYDDACSSMEATRNKHTKNPSEKNKRKVQEKETAMNNAKNEYLIKVNQANRTKDKYYFQDVPECLDLLQGLNESKVLFLNDIWKRASSLEKSFTERVNKRLDASDSVVVQNKPSLNTAMFIKHNVKQWREPPDFQFKPSPVWHDDEKFCVPSQLEANALVVKLAQSESEYLKYNDLAQGELSQLSALNKKKQEMASNEDNIKGNEFFEILKSYLALISPFTSHETLKLQAEVQIESIQNNVPEEYDLTTTHIDTSKKKKGIFSKLKENLLNPEARPSSHGQSSTVSSHSPRINILGNNRNRSGTTASTMSATSSRTDGMQSVASPTREQSNKNRVLYAYAEQDTDEVSVSVGDSFTVITADDGSGWTKITNTTTGKSGLVPSSYIEIREEASHSSRGPPPAAPPSRRTTLPVRTITSQYEYTSQGDDELSLAVGDVVTVLKGDDGSGWTYGELNGHKGLVPTSYCT
ncbi:Protein BZZ1 [Nakaseomyces glabratus]|nr:Protein BZZ1 [Nakaseomyces glabratus]KTB12984.1 Protein BZZ1 [Nakaseomyces glabratus]